MMKNKKLLKSILFSLVFLTLPNFASAATYYLSPTGSDTTGTGSYENPWFSPAKARKSTGAIAPGDMVIFKDGTYNYTPTSFSLGYSANDSGEPNSPITYKAENTGSVIIRFNCAGTGSAGAGIWFQYQSGASYIIVDGLIVLNAGAIFRIDDDHVTLRNISGSTNDEWPPNLGTDTCQYATGSGCVQTFEHGTDFLVENSEFADCSYANSQHGIYMSGGAGTIRNNIFRDNIGNGIQMQDKGVGHSVGTVYVYGNKIYNNEAWHGIYARAYNIGGGCSDTSNIYVFNNLIWNNSWNGSGYGIVATEDNDCPLHMSIYNNTIWNNKNGIINDVAAGSGNIRNNIVVNNINSDFAYGVTCSSPVTVRSNNLSTSGTELGCGVEDSFSANDFISTDLNSSDFLKLSSSGTNAIDQGFDLSSVFTSDYFGNSRPQGNAYDIGAYEYSSGDITSPSSPSGLSVL